MPADLALGHRSFYCLAREMHPVSRCWRAIGTQHCMQTPPGNSTLRCTSGAWISLPRRHSNSVRKQVLCRVVDQRPPFVIRRCPLQRLPTSFVVGQPLATGLLLQNTACQQCSAAKWNFCSSAFVFAQPGQGNHLSSCSENSHQCCGI